MFRANIADLGKTIFRKLKYIFDSSVTIVRRENEEKNIYNYSALAGSFLFLRYFCISSDHFRNFYG